MRITSAIRSIGFLVKRRDHDRQHDESEGSEQRTIRRRMMIRLLI